MKRILASALILGVCSLTGLPGCGEEAGTTSQTTVETPGGTTTTTKSTEVETSGANPPAPAPAGGTTTP